MLNADECIENKICRMEELRDHGDFQMHLRECVCVQYMVNE